MNIKTIALFLTTLTTLWLTQGCTSPKPESTTTEVEVEEAEAETEGESETTSAVDKSQRPSPPVSISSTINDLNLTLDYSSPSVKGRTIWGDLVSYDQVWRTGANEANVFSVDQDVMVNGEKLPSGKYALFTIPAEGEWTVIFNKVYDQWGAFNYDEAEDALRITVQPTSLDEPQERLSFDVKDDGTIAFAWGNLSFSFKVTTTSE